VKDQLAEIERAAREAVAIDRQEAGHSFYQSSAASTSYGAPPPPPPPPLPLAPSFLSDRHGRQILSQGGDAGVSGEEGLEEEEEQGLVLSQYDPLSFITTLESLLYSLPIEFQCTVTMI
jgi:hypothetical protein